MGTNKYLDFEPDTDAEQLMFLVGRIEAFAAYVNSHNDIDIDRNTCAEILGFELLEERK